MFGHAGKILRVNLRKKEVKAESLRESFTRGFLGGIGFATKLFTEVVNPMVDPLSSENELIFMVGPLTGTRAPMCSRHVVVAKSPLTNAWGQSDAGGYWAAELKFAGFDGIILDKVADEPLYLWVNDGTAELFNASDIWGLDTYETEDALKREHGERVKVLSIGPAGEKLVRIASLMNDKGRAAGRRGLGAVMGSKRLKAIAVKGSHPPEVYDEEMLSELQGEIVSHLLSQGGIRNLMEYGTAYPLRENDLPLKNWLKSNWEAEKIEGLSGKRMKETIQVGRRACYGCPVGCERVVQVKQTPYAMEEEGRGIEYEGIAAMGSLCLNCNLNALAKVNDIANRCGIDVITAGTLIAFTMEIYERGLITKEDLGMEIDWGDADAVIELVRMIAERRGFGNVLAEGPKRATDIIGKGSGDYMPK